MHSRLVAFVLAMVALSGCLQSQEGLGDGNSSGGVDNLAGNATTSHPTDWLAVHTDYTGCLSFNAFFIVDYERSDPWLPPGFVPRDLSGFLFFTPAIYGQTLAHVAVIQCDESPWGAVRTGYVGFFVHAPDIPEAGDAPYHFYNVLEFTDNPARVADLQQQLGWPTDSLAMVVGYEAVADQGIDDSPVPAPVPDRAGVYLGGAAAPGMYTFNGTGVYQQAFDGPPMLRFWRDLPAGLAFSEFPLPMRTVPAGPLDVCRVIEGSPVYEVIGEVDCGPANGDPFDSFALVFPPHDLTGITFATMPGVRASV